MTTQYSQNREEMAKAEIGRTSIKPAVVVCMIVLFVAVMFGAPLVQAIWEMRQHMAGTRDTPLPAAFHAFNLISSPIRTVVRTKAGLFHRILSANSELKREIDRFEDRLEDESALVKLVLPPTQHILSGLLGAGNEKVYCGRDGWLFYRPEIDYLTGPGFLEPRELAYREENESVQSDPRLAILQFNEQLRRRGIHLVVLPVPVKPMVHPEKFASSYERKEILLQNPSYDRFRADLERADVTVFDMSLIMASARNPGRDLYLRTDTHWRPETIERAASELASFVTESGWLPPIPSVGYSREQATISNQGDIAAMLQLPREQTLYPQETVNIMSVLTPDGELWRASSTADILVLGDSFFNIYSMAAMGWGEAAGFIEQFSHALQRPVDCILRNDNGAFSTRKILSDELVRGRDRLDGKRIVIYQFATRELVVGDWKLLDLESPEKPPDRFFRLAPEQAITVTGIVESVSLVPAPHSVPYKDHILTVHLSGIEHEDGTTEDGDTVIHMWSMRDNVWTDAARYRPGQRITVLLRPWSDVSLELDRFNRSELDDERLWLAEPCWGEPATP